jgi:hypothetical protein
MAWLTNITRGLSGASKTQGRSQSAKLMTARNARGKLQNSMDCFTKSFRFGGKAAKCSDKVDSMSSRCTEMNDVATLLEEKINSFVGSKADPTEFASELVHLIGIERVCIEELQALHSCVSGVAGGVKLFNACMR